MQHVRKKFETNDKYTLLLLSLVIFLWLQLVQYIVIVCTVLTFGYLSLPISDTKLPNVKRLNLK